MKKGIERHGGVPPLILNLSTRWRWMVNCTIRQLYPQGKGHQYPLQRRLCGPHSWHGHPGEDTPKPQPPWCLMFNWERQRWDVWLCLCMIHMKLRPWDTN